MDPKNELLDNLNIDFIKEEEIDEECYVEPGETVSLKVDKVSIKKELPENEKIENFSFSNV